MNEILNVAETTAEVVTETVGEEIVVDGAKAVVKLTKEGKVLVAITVFAGCAVVALIVRAIVKLIKDRYNTDDVEVEEVNVEEADEAEEVEETSETEEEQ